MAHPMYCDNCSILSVACSGKFQRWPSYVRVHRTFEDECSSDFFAELFRVFLLNELPRVAFTML